MYYYPFTVQVLFRDQQSARRHSVDLVNQDGGRSRELKERIEGLPEDAAVFSEDALFYSITTLSQEMRGKVRIFVLLVYQ